MIFVSGGRKSVARILGESAQGDTMFMMAMPYRWFDLVVDILGSYRTRVQVIAPANQYTYRPLGGQVFTYNVVKVQEDRGTVGSSPTSGSLVSVVTITILRAGPRRWCDIQYDPTNSNKTTGKMIEHRRDRVRITDRGQAWKDHGRVDIYE